MPAYTDVDRDSGVARYEIGEDFIDVEFKGGGAYRYGYAATGAAHVETMKLLAGTGTGLNAYINRHVRERYDRRLW